MYLDQSYRQTCIFSPSLWIESKTLNNQNLIHNLYTHLVLLIQNQLFDIQGDRANNNKTNAPDSFIEIFNQTYTTIR